MRPSLRLLLMAVLFSLAACQSPAAPDSGPIRVRVGLGFIPNVQFAPFYVAARKGYYAEEGLEVELTYGGNVNDLLVEAASGQLPFLMASGDEVLLARSQQIPVKMVFLMFQKAPVAVFSKAETGVTTPQDLQGQTIGVPGRFGATYIGLRGLLFAVGLEEQDVNLREIGFTQFEAVSAGEPPIAVGYANNEPLRLAENGVAVNVINVSDYIQIVSNGIVVSETYAKDNPETVRKFLRATRRGLEDTLNNPDEAFDLAVQDIPELTADQQPFQRAVLAATLDYWRAPEPQTVGWLNPPAWQETYAFLSTSAILSAGTEPSQAYTEEFLE